MNPQEYLKLASVRGGRISLESNALDRLGEYDFIQIITFEGTIPQLTIINGETGYEISEEGIYLSKYPEYSVRLKTYIIILRCILKDERDLALGHIFCSLISHLVVVGGIEGMRLEYLGGVRDVRGDVKGKISGLVGVAVGYDSREINEGLEALGRALETQGVSKLEIMGLYPLVTCLTCPPSVNLQKILPFLEDMLDQNPGNSEVLLHGEIVKEYAMHLQEQYRNSSFFTPSLAEEQIELDENFHTYIQSLTNYNTKCKNILGNDGHADIALKLKKIREETESEPLYEGDVHYAGKIEMYMDRKEGELMGLNSQLNDTYNINILQKESAKSLENVMNNRNNITNEDISKEIDRITRKYGEKSRGINSQKLFSEFMQVFVPSIYAEAGLEAQTDRKIEKLVGDNAGLEEEIRKLQKKQGKCCLIM